jgi:hypothetical protein
MYIKIWVMIVIGGGSSAAHDSAAVMPEKERLPRQKPSRI